MNLLTKNMYRALVLAYTWGCDIRKWTMVKMGDMNSNISYRIGPADKVRKHRKFETTDCNSYLNLTVERKGLIIGEVTRPYVE